MSILDICTVSPLQCPRGISQNVSGLYSVRRGSGYKIHMCVKLYYLGRTKVLSSVATDFGFWTIRLSPLKSPILRKYTNPFKRCGMYPNISKCNAKRCKCCKQLSTKTTVTSSVNGRQFSVIYNSELCPLKISVGNSVRLITLKTVEIFSKNLVQIYIIIR